MKLPSRRREDWGVGTWLIRVRGLEGAEVYG